MTNGMISLLLTGLVVGIAAIVCWVVIIAETIAIRRRNRRK